MIVENVKPQVVDDIFPLFSSDVAKCLDEIRADCAAGDLWRMCRDGSAFLLIAHEDGNIKAATIWRFETWLHGPVLKNLVAVNVGAGAMADWLPQMNEAARTIAKVGGADRFIWQGREAWGRVFKDAKKLATIFEMRV